MAERYRTFRELLEAQPQNNTAVIYYEQGDKKTLLYRDVLDLVYRYPVPGAGTVGIVCDNSLDSVIAVMALAGKRQIVLLNPSEPVRVIMDEMRKTHVTELIGELPVEAVVTEPIDKLSEEIASDKDVQDMDPQKGEESTVQGCHESSAANTDILFFTSGTTAQNKAVILDESRLCSAAYNGGCMLPLEPSDILLSVLPHAHVFGFVCSLLWPLSFGASVALGRGIKSIFLDFIDFCPTVTSLVPQIAGFLAAKKLFNPELRLVLIGAGDCSDECLNAIHKMGIRVSFGYGLTETSSGIALSIGEDPRLMSICPDYRVEIAEDSEIIVSSDTTLMKGYYEDPQATRAVMEGNKLHTGDLGCLEDGMLRITGRKKDILVLGDGTKIYLPSYEEHLGRFLGSIPGLKTDFAVSISEDSVLTLAAACGGDSGTLPLQEANDADAVPEALRKAVDRFNEEYPRGQRIGRIVMVPSIPRTVTGKVKRYDLP